MASDGSALRQPTAFEIELTESNVLVNAQLSHVQPLLDDANAQLPDARAREQKLDRENRESRERLSDAIARNWSLFVNRLLEQEYLLNQMKPEMVDASVTCDILKSINVNSSRKTTMRKSRSRIVIDSDK